MILAGALCARIAAEAGVPAIYRRQAPPTAPVDPLPPGAHDPVLVRRVRRLLPRGESALVPARHHGLGLDAYAQVTSPLRRYQDLATQRQIHAVLAGASPPYDLGAMQRIAATTERAEADARRAERAADAYWTLRYLEQRVGAVVDAVVVDVVPRTFVQLTETLWEQPVPSVAGVAPGEAVRLRIVRVNPRAGLLSLQRV
jgi:exoribonuclease-2